MHRNTVGTLAGWATDASKELSGIDRKLCFSAIAIVWVLREAAKDHVLSEDLRLVLVLITLSLTVDFLQYLYKTIAWYALSKTKGKKNNEAIVVYPEWVEGVSYVIWALKIGLCLGGYVYLLRELYRMMGL